MSLIRSVLLGLAAGIAAVSNAASADLPTRKAGPVEYVRICDIGGITGWVMPGSETCVKLSGFVTGQFYAGNLSQQWLWSGNQVTHDGTLAGMKLGLVHGEDVWARDAIGFTARTSTAFDFASNTAYGPLLGHINLFAEAGSGFEAPANDAYLNRAYVTWAGITAGKANSFFSLFGCGETWPCLFSPDRRSWNQPNLMAYTASFSGGFSATLSFESPGTVGASGPGTRIQSNGVDYSDTGNLTYAGQRWPDIVGALNLKQDWGEAQLSGVLHQVDVRGVNGFDSSPIGSENTFGWAVLAGTKIKLPSLSPADVFMIQGVYSRNAIWYSGIPEQMWGENGQVNGNGQQQFIADAYFNGLAWGAPSAWSVEAIFQHFFTPEIYVFPEASVAGLSWSNSAGLISPHMTSWILGADIGWTPVKSLNFDLDLNYQTTNQARPTAYVGLNPWVSNSSGFVGRLRITRNF
jgi:Porin subfamily